MKYEISKTTTKKKVIFAILVLIVIIIILLLAVSLRKKEHTIIFDSNGGTEVASITVKENESVTRPEDPTREGYIFSGWYYNEELYDFEIPLNENIVLKAKWLEEGNVEIQGIELNTKEISIAPGETAVLVATFIPENSKVEKLVWSSSDKSIATVDENGNIKGIKEGEVTITVATEDGKYTATSKVTITKDTVEVTGVSISGSKEVSVGSSIKLKATVTPDNASNKTVVWSSSNQNIAKVDQNGNVKGLKAGTVTITVTTSDGGYKATYTVTVKANKNNTNNNNSSNNNNSQTNNNTEKPSTPSTPNTPNTPSEPSTPITTKVTGVTVKGTTSLKVKGTGTLKATVIPSNATNKNVKWSSSDTNVVTVDSNGNIKGVGEGEATITVTTEDGGYTATIKVTVSSVYVITFKANVNELGAVFDYTVSVTRDGVAFSNYLTITYNGQTKPFKQNYQGEVNKSVQTATINLSGGKKVTATVQYR